MNLSDLKALSAEQGVLRYLDEQGYLRIAALGSVREELLAVVEAAQLDWKDLRGAIGAAHGEFCISSDNCDCGKRSSELDVLEAALAALDARLGEL